MKKPLYFLLVVLLCGAAFLLGSLDTTWRDSSSGGSAGRQVLYYVDPMNPSHTSCEPGLAPCGMKMEPVYADEGEVDGSSFPAGTVRVSPEKQQVIGVQTQAVLNQPLDHTVRLLGRVAPDENRLYLINATVDGWITEVGENTTGSLVKKNEVLATFYSPEFLTAEQALLFALSAQDRVRVTGKETPGQQDQLTQFKINIRQYTDSLRNLGMGELQVQEMIERREYMENIYITAPADGFVIFRYVSPGLRFEKGTELYRIADLSRVWILADLFENEAPYVKPGETVQISLLHQKKTLNATVSEVLPWFDPESRTLKVRLECDNPDFILRPDMFVDVEFPVRLPPMIRIPADALLDSGLRKTVFVDRGGGYFEARQVETGRRIGDRVEILEGLAPGDRIVTSGTFLLDSESRMKMAAAGVHQAPAKDVVCNMDVDPAMARSAGRVSMYQGQMYFFCCDHCKKEFESNPSYYLGTTGLSGDQHD